MIGGIGQNQTQQTESLRHTEQTQRADQVSSGALSGSGSVSFYEPGMQVKGADGRVVPIAAPDAGAMQMMSKMDTSELTAMLSGLRADNEETMAKASEEATLANKERAKSIRDQKIQELEKALQPPPKKKKKCAVAKIVIGSVLVGVGTPLIVRGAKDLKQYNSEVKAVNAERNQMMQNHFQQNHGEVKGFKEEYSRDYVDSNYDVQGGRVSSHTNKSQHIAKLESMKARGILDDQGFQNLKELVNNDATPREMNEGFLRIAIAGKVDRDAAGIHLENETRAKAQVDSSDMSSADIMSEVEGMKNDKEFQKFLQNLAASMENEAEVMQQIEESLNNAASLAISGTQNMQYQQGMMMRHI